MNSMTMRATAIAGPIQRTSVRGCETGRGTGGGGGTVLVGTAALVAAEATGARLAGSGLSGAAGLGYAVLAGAEVPDAAPSDTELGAVGLADGRVGAALTL